MKKNKVNKNKNKKIINHQYQNKYFFEKMYLKKWNNQTIEV